LREAGARIPALFRAALSLQSDRLKAVGLTDKYLGLQ
jgi:hypothetical protein